MQPVVYIRQATFPFRRLCRPSAIEIHRAWQLMEPSSLEFDTPADDGAVDTNAMQPGNIVEVVSDMASWWGVLKVYEQPMGGSTIHWIAEDFLSLLDERIVPIDLAYDGYAAGHIFMDIMNYAHRQSPLPIGFSPSGVYLGPSVTMDVSNGTSVMDALRELANLSDCEFGVVPVSGSSGFTAPQYVWTYRMGSRRRSIIITNDHLVSGEYSIDPKGTPLLTRVITAGESRDAVTGPSIPAMSDGAFPVNSGVQYRPGIGTVITVFDIKRNSAQRRAEKQLVAPRYGRELFNFSINTRMAWNMGIGDLVRMRLANARYGATIDRYFRVTGIQPDEYMGECVLLGEVTDAFLG